MLTVSIAERGKTPPHQKKVVLGMRLNCTDGSSNSGDLESVKYFIAITSRFTLIQWVRVLSMGQIDLFKNYLYLIGPCAKKILSSNNAKSVIYEHTMNVIP